MTYSLKERHYQSSGAIPIRGKTEVTNRETKRLNANPFTLSSHPSLVSSSEGKIASVLLTIPNYAAKRFSNTYNQIFGKLPFDTAFVVAVHDATRNEVESWIASHGIEDRSTIVPLPNFLNFSVWAVDAYVTISDGAQNTPVLVEPFEFPRYADSLVADYVSSNTTILGSTTPLYFQGGNILIGDDFFLIGSDYPRRTLDYVGKQILPEEGETSAELVRRLYKEFLDHKRAIHYVGTARTLPSEKRALIEVEGETWSEIRFYGNAEGTKQPIFHIDMFISPAGRSENGDFQLLVGDPAAAARLIDMPLPEAAALDGHRLHRLA